MAELITKSNSDKKRCKDKRGELLDLDREIEKNAAELCRVLERIWMPLWGDV